MYAPKPSTDGDPTVYTRNSAKYRVLSFEPEEFTQEAWKEMREDISMAQTSYDAPRHVEAEITLRSHGSEEELEGVMINSGINHPRFRFGSGEHGFLSLHGSVGDLRILFQKPWDGGGSRAHKYPVSDLQFRAYHFETPVCPTCDVGMEFGMPKGYDDHEEYPVAAWLCPECFPGRYDGGIR